MTNINRLSQDKWESVAIAVMVIVFTVTFFLMGRWMVHSSGTSYSTTGMSGLPMIVRAQMMAMNQNLDEKQSSIYARVEHQGETYIVIGKLVPNGYKVDLKSRARDDNSQRVDIKVSKPIKIISPAVPGETIRSVIVVMLNHSTDAVEITGIDGEVYKLIK